MNPLPSPLGASWCLRRPLRLSAGLPKPRNSPLARWMAMPPIVAVVTVVLGGGLSTIPRNCVTITVAEPRALYNRVRHFLVRFSERSSYV